LTYQGCPIKDEGKREMNVPLYKPKPVLKSPTFSSKDVKIILVRKRKKQDNERWGAT